MPSLAPMLEKVTPGVVLISVTGTHVEKSKVPDAFKFFFGNPNQNQNQSREREFRGLGSGVIIDADKGYIVTNNHVIQGADDILVSVNGSKEYKAKVLGAIYSNGKKQ